MFKIGQNQANILTVTIMCLKTNALMPTVGNSMTFQARINVLMQIIQLNSALENRCKIDNLIQQIQIKYFNFILLKKA